MLIIGFGVPKLGKASSGLPLVDHGPDSSTNTLLEQTLDQPGMPAAIHAWLDKLPVGKPILVIAPPNNMPAALTADTISYLAWPRPVVVSKTTEETRELMKTARERFVAVGFCYFPAPPGVTQGKTFGPALRFISSQPLPE